jgi:hypothetical protein
MKSRTILFTLFLILAFAGLPAYGQTFTGCFAHHPQYLPGTIEINYSPGCVGHDEPELDPVSSAPGSARDLTWTVVLPTNNRTQVSDVGPAFWFGGVVHDPKSLLGQAFVELQFYPNSLVFKCFADGAFAVSFAPNTYTSCSPVFKVVRTGQRIFLEKTAFNAMLEDNSTPRKPLVMHSGDTITVHYFVTAAQDGFHIAVDDLNTGRSGTIILNSPSDGPLMPFFDSQLVGNALGWGLVSGTPNSFVWEIGHESIFTDGGAFCVPGQTVCDSYNASSWAGFLPIQIKGVTFGDGSTPTSWAVVSDQGGKTEVLSNCASYGGPFCIYPWYTLGTSGFHFGIDYPDNLSDFGKANQFAQTKKCGGPFGADTTYCAKIILH